MYLLLVRHGEAAPAADDAARPLTLDGRRAVESIAAHLAAAGVRTRAIRHSGRRRAEQTAAILMRALAPPGGCEAVPGLDPMDDVDGFAYRLDPGELPLMLVGHMPFMGRLASRLLTGEAERTAIAFPPGGVACLRSGPRGAWGLAWLLPPSLIRQREP